MIKDIKSVYNILNAINGKLRTPKIDGFNRLVDFLRLKGGVSRDGDRGTSELVPRSPSYSIEKLPLDTSPLSSNA